jgi:general secretion pathway protein B
MSLILEALRKSEAERRRSEAPNVYSELPSASRPGRANRIPAIGWALAAIVVLLLLWGGATLLRGTQDAPMPVAHVVRVEPRPITHRALPLPVVPHLTPAAATPPPSAVKAPSPPLPARVLSTTVPSIQAPTPVSPPIAAPAHDDTLRLSDLSPDERKALPPLKLSMHMWNDDPSQRFVILDGNRLREGDRVGDAVVTAITTDGVVLDWNGRKLKLPIR